MNGKQAKSLRRMAEHVTVGRDIETTIEIYKAMKKKYKNKDTSVKAKPILDRNPLKEIVGARSLEKGTPPRDRWNHSTNRVRKGYIGATGRTYSDGIARRYHPTKGFRKDGLFDLHMEKEAIADRLSRGVR